MPLYKQKHEDGVAGIQPLALASSVAWKQTFCSQLCCFVSFNFFTLYNSTKKRKEVYERRL